MKKKILLFLSIFFIFSIKANAGSGLIDIYTSNKTPVVGNNITITVNTSASTNIFVYEYTLSYDSSKLKFVSSTGNCADLHCAGSVTSGKVTDTLTFKVIAAGSTQISAKSYSIILEDETEAATKVDATSINASNTAPSNKPSGNNSSGNTSTPKTYSTNNNLKSLKIEGYELSPAFNKDTLEYSTTLPNTIEKIKILAEAEDSKSNIKGNGELEITEGDNKLEIIVTSEKGTTKTYIINAKVIDDKPIEVYANNKTYTLIKRKNNLEAPANYTETTIKINDIDIPAFYNEITKYTLVGLKDTEGNVNLYIYNKKNNQYTKYEVIDSNNITIIPITPNKLLDNTTKTTIKINDQKIEAYKYKKSSIYSLIYGMNIETGQENWYQYDETENTIQKLNLELIKDYNEKEEDSNKLILALSATSIFFAILLIITFFSKSKKKNKSKRKEKTIIDDDKEITTTIITK